MPVWSRRVIQSAAAVAVTAIILWLLLYYSNINSLAAEWHDADVVYLGLASPLILLVTFIRAWRLASLLERPLDGILVRISIYHNLIANLIPFRLGEVALPLLLRRAGIERASTALGLLLIIRAVEFLVIAILGGCAVGLATFTTELFPGMKPLALVLAAAAAAALVLAPALGGGAATFLSRRPGVQRSRFAPSILGFAAAFQNVDRSAFARLVAQTTILNVALFVYYALCAHAFHAEHDVFGVVAAAAAGAVAFALPINGIAGFGPFEAAWVFALQLQAVPFEAALVSGFVAHTMMTLGLGLIALIALVSAKPIA